MQGHMNVKFGYYNLIKAYYSQCILCTPFVQQSDTLTFHYQLVS